MKRFILLLVFISIVATSSNAQKIFGFGGEISIVSIKPTYRYWFNKTSGISIFAGVSSELDDIKPNDMEAGLTYLHALITNRADRTYVGLTGKWKWINVYGSNMKANLPIPGVFIGKEWFKKRTNSTGFAIEVGYQVGSTNLIASDPNGIISGKNTFDEFPLILNLRYSFYTKKR
jgi:hypothetical protein